MNRTLIGLGCLALVSISSEICADPMPRHRPFWGGALGVDYSDNVYRDRSEEGDAGYDVRIRVGLRSRYSRKTFSQVHYDLDTLAFRGASVENRADHGIEALVRRRISEPATLELKGGGQVSRFANVPAFHSRAVFAQIALKSYVASRATIEAGLEGHDRVYGQYDLDHSGARLFATFAQELNRRTSAEAAAVYRRDGYSERRARRTVAADPLALRADSDWLVGARLVHDLSLVLRVDAGYRYGRLSSTGGSLEFGSPEPEAAETVAGDRLPGDDYSHTRHEIGARLRRLVRKGSSVTMIARFQDRAFRARLAHDGAGAALIPAQRRHDRGLWVSGTWDHPLPGLPDKLDRAHVGFRVSLSHEIHSSNDTLYDYTATALGLFLTTWF